MQPLSEVLVSQLVSEGLLGIKKILSPKDLELKVTKEDLVSSIFVHYEFLRNTTKFISFKELKHNKYLSRQYIDLDVELQSRRFKLKLEDVEKRKINEVISVLDGHLVILGGPGAGKTTSVRKICQNFLNSSYSGKFNFPVLVNLRDIPTSESIYSKINSILGLEIVLKKDGSTSFQVHNLLREKYTNKYLNELEVILILDGLDEVNPLRLEEFNNEIRSLVTNISNSLVVVTCRTASFNITLENTTEFELCNLTSEQINEFVQKWFSNSKENIGSFLKELESSKFIDLSLRPITLAHLCAIYERTKKFYDKPKSVYKKLVRLLIEDWDEQRGIIRDSNYSNFDNETKFEFLCYFAYQLTITFQYKVYSEDHFLICYEKIYSFFELPKNQGILVVKEIEEHTGIIIKSGYDSFEFVHKSMQEYLAAEYIVKMGKIPTKLIYDNNISNELAIAVSLSSDANSYYYNLVFDLLGAEVLTKQFVIEFLNRLEYENANFRVSILLPYSFIVIYNRLLDNGSLEGSEVDYTFNDAFAEIITSFKKSYTMRKSFLLFANFFGVKKAEGKKRYLLKSEHTLWNELTDDEQFYLTGESNLTIDKKLFDTAFS